MTCTSAGITPPEPQAARGCARLYIDHVADRGADFDFLVGKTGSPVPATTTVSRSSV
jgi:L-arabonate dehydrase